ncbi:MAG: outer membrane protein assembly factor BamD [Bacteroidales bacterium]|nr:outer membrane protein assembly factor BamD [Bacteroidales bacterium]
MNMKKWLLMVIFLLLLALLSCVNYYDKILKEGTFYDRLEAANDFYHKKNYYRAREFYESVITEAKGSAQFEEILFSYAYCLFYQEEYLMAAFYFKDFAMRLPRSKNAEEALYMSAYSKYLASPEPTLDQSITIEAINDFQLFVNRYPNSTRVDLANQFMDELQEKLEKKEYLKAYTYYKTENYKAAITTFNNFLRKYPFSTFRENVLYYLTKSQYFYALNSIQEKKSERFQEVLKNINYFKKQYPDSKYNKELSEIQNKIEFVQKKQLTI